MKSKNNKQIDSEIDDGIALSVNEETPNKLIINDKNSFSEGTHIEGDLTISGKLNILNNKMFDDIHKKINNMSHKHHNNDKNYYC